MNTAIELTYNINAACVFVWQVIPPSDPLTLPEPNLNLFPTAIQNGHINLIIRCVIRLADERLSLDGIKSVLPPLCGPTPCYKIEKGVGDGTFWRRKRVADVVFAVATLHLVHIFWGCIPPRYPGVCNYISRMCVE